MCQNNYHLNYSYGDSYEYSTNQSQQQQQYNLGQPQVLEYSTAMTSHGRNSINRFVRQEEHLT